MANVELRREALPHPTDDRALVTALAFRAEAVLGYSWLRRHLGVNHGPLAAAMNDLGIQPFRADDIKRYKAEKARELDDRLWAEFTSVVLGAGPTEASNAGSGQASRPVYSRAGRNSFLGVFLLGSYARAKWHTLPLKGYDGPVPEFALSRALELKERLPEVEFEIEELRADQRYDPFLVAKCGSERFYIDVWEEREFERQHG